MVEGVRAVGLLAGGSRGSGGARGASRKGLFLVGVLIPQGIRKNAPVINLQSVCLIARVMPSAPTKMTTTEMTKPRCNWVWKPPGKGTGLLLAVSTAQGPPCLLTKLPGKEPTSLVVSSARAKSVM